jgi:hypothetical protein
MRIPTIKGVIDRRILINFTSDPAVVAAILPPPFRPKLYQNRALVGICLIRLKNIKPKGFPAFMGLSSENGAHRIAIEWEESGQVKEGVFVPRRDTSLKLNACVGGRLFPGKHYLADFKVQEADGKYAVELLSADGTTVAIAAAESEAFEANSIFGTLENASGFFERGEVGYSPNGAKFDGLRLQTKQWLVKPLRVSQVQSSFFENESIFPKGSVKFDNALLMTKIEHEWHSVESK